MCYYMVRMISYTKNKKTRSKTRKVTETINVG